MAGRWNRCATVRGVRSPQKSPVAVEEAVLSVRQAHPAWGGREIAHVLERDRPLRVAPSTVTPILHRHKLIEPAASEAATPWKRFEREHPNSLWPMDFKGHFAVGDGRGHPLTVLDDHSRYNVALIACANEQRATVQVRWSGSSPSMACPSRSTPTMVRPGAPLARKP